MFFGLHSDLYGHKSTSCSPWKSKLNFKGKNCQIRLRNDINPTMPVLKPIVWMSRSGTFDFIDIMIANLVFIALKSLQPQCLDVRCVPTFNICWSIHNIRLHVFNEYKQNEKRKINFETAFTVLHRDLRVTMYIRKKMKIKIDRKFTPCTVYIWNWTSPWKIKNVVSK